MTISSEPAVLVEGLGVPVVDTGIVDLDVHPTPPPGALRAYLPRRWRDYDRVYGRRSSGGSMIDYPPLVGYGQRGDLWGPNGEFPGSSVEAVRAELLEPYDVQLGMLQCLDTAAQALNQDFAAALCRAVNDWELEHMVYPEPRLRAAIAIAYESTEHAVDEITRIGSDPGVRGISMLAKTAEPLGRRRYWPIYEAAERHSLPILVHLSSGGGHANSPSGWTAYHPEYHVAHTVSFQTLVASLIFEGTFDAFPRLKFALVEGGLTHYATWFQRLDYTWETLRAELPDLQRKPSEYIHDHFFFSTQPMDEPRKPEHLLEMLYEIGEDNIVFATDYPHFDFDSPVTALPGNLPQPLREKILRGNGARLFDLEEVSA